MSEQQPEQQESRTVDVTLSVTADHGWDENSTPAIAHIQGDDVDFYHAVTPDADGNKGTSTVELAEGDYTVSFVSPVNSEDFCIRHLRHGRSRRHHRRRRREDRTCRQLLYGADSRHKVTDDMLAGIVDKTKDAIKKGDETLKGDAGTNILDKLDGNVAKNPNASDKTKTAGGD